MHPVVYPHPAHTTVAGLLDDGSRVALAAVVHDDQLPSWVALRQDRFDGEAKALRPVVGRQHDKHKGVGAEPRVSDEAADGLDCLEVPEHGQARFGVRTRSLEHVDSGCQGVDARLDVRQARVGHSGMLDHPTARPLGEPSQ